MSFTDIFLTILVTVMFFIICDIEQRQIVMKRQVNFVVQQLTEGDH